MRLPRHDTPLSLPAEPPRAAISRDEALLDSPGTQRWWIASSPAVVVGLAQHLRVGTIVDLERCQRAAVDVVSRRAGGGALLLDDAVVCGAVSVPTRWLPHDVTDSYRCLSQRLVRALTELGIAGRRLEVAEARADTAALRAAGDATSSGLLNTCYGQLSPHEIVVDGRKLVGLAQIRRRDASLFQFGILLRDQARLADYLQVPSAGEREALRAALARRTIGLQSLTRRSAAEVAGAVAGAMPSAP